MFPNMWRVSSERVSELIGGWVWLLGWGDSGFWSAVLTVSVGSDYIYSDFTVRGVPSHLPQKRMWMWCVVVTVWFRCSQELWRRDTPTTRNEPEWPRCFQQCEFWVDFSFKVCVQSWQRCEKPRFRAWWGGEDHGSHEASTGRRHLTVSSGGSQGSRTPAERS